MSAPKEEICTIRIMFPVESDEQAIDYKKKIDALLINVPDVQLHFALLPAPPKPPPR